MLVATLIDSARCSTHIIKTLIIQIIQLLLKICISKVTLYIHAQMPHGGIKDVTEECFQQTPLEFEGEDQWVVYR